MNKETEKIKCHQEKNTSGSGVKQEMTDEKIQKKAKNPVCISCWNTVLKLLQLFWFMEVEFDPYIYRQWQLWKGMRNDLFVWYLTVIHFYKKRSLQPSHLLNELAGTGIH